VILQRALQLGWKPGEPIMSRLILKPIERNPWQADIGTTYSSMTGIDGNITLGHRNVLGAGECLTFKAQGRGSFHQFQVDMNKPELGRSHNKIGLSLFSGNNADISSPWRQHSTGVSIYKSIGTTWVGQDRWEYQAAARNFVPLANAPLELRTSAGESFLSSVQYTRIVDRRDDPLVPSVGWAYKLFTQLAGLGGDVRFLRQNAIYQHNYSFLPGWVITLNRSPLYYCSFTYE